MVDAAQADLAVTRRLAAEERDAEAAFPVRDLAPCRPARTTALKNAPTPTDFTPRRFATLSCTSNTNMRSGRWTCGPASPTPSYACIVSIMSSISALNLPALMSLISTSDAFLRNTGCPRRDTLRIDMDEV